MTDAPAIKPARCLPEIDNPRLLTFLAIALHAKDANRPLAQVAGIGGCDLALFRAVAVEAGFLDSSDRVTRAGLTYARSQLSILAPLFFAVTPGEALT